MHFCDRIHTSIKSLGSHGANMSIQAESIYSLILKSLWCIEISSGTVSLSRILVEPLTSIIASVVLEIEILLDVKPLTSIISSYED